MSVDGQLLERLRQELGCVYLSELREAGYQASAIRRAAELPPEDYPLSQWQDAAAYLTRCACTFETAQQVRDYFASCPDKS